MNSSQLIPVAWFRPQSFGRALGRVFPSESLFGELDRLFDGLLGQEAGRGAESAPAVRPSLDISGNDKQYTVSVELPGVDAKDLHVDLEKNVLTIQGEKRSQHEEAASGDNSGQTYYRMERSYGSFKRVLTLPDDVDADGIQATHKDGLLLISLPRKAQLTSEQRSITVNQG